MAARTEFSGLHAKHIGIFGRCFRANQDGDLPTGTVDPIAAGFDPLSDQFKGQTAAIAPRGFDLIFEVSGAAGALKQAIFLSKKGGTLVQVGTLPEEVSLPANLIMAKELSVVGSFRFANVIEAAIDLVASGRAQFDRIITHTFFFDRLIDGMQKACSREDIVKIQIDVNN